ncbi:MAG: trigger factor [Deltaproteobacteria bacterium]|nr:trigger factor [Deltaproteobacteria bacterium]
MKVNVEDVSSVKKTLKIEVPEETIVKELDSAYLQLKKNAKIKGFRPGKAPRSVLERLYRKDVHADVLSRLIQSSFVEAVKETGLKIIGSPKVDPPDLETKGDYAYDAVVEVSPELEDVEIKGLALTRTNYKVGDDEIDIQLQALQKNMAKQEKIEEDRPAAKDDFVVIDYEGFKDGEAFPETALTENFTLKIGEGHIAEAFDDKMIGMKAGEERDITVDFPADYFNEKLQGLSIDFNVKMHEIKAEKLPELDDAFAKSMGPFETLDALKNVIKDNLTQGYEKRIDQELSEQIFETLISKVEFEVPEVMVEFELENIISDTERSFQYQNRSMDEVGLTREKLTEQYRGVAEKQARRQVILNKVIEQEALELADEDLEKGFADMAANFNQPVEQVKTFYDQSKDKLEFFKHALLEKQAIKLIIDNGNIEDVEPVKETSPAATSEDTSKEE